MPLTEMCAQEASTRKDKAITEQMCGIQISAIQVSQAAKRLDEVLQEWREHPMGDMR